MTWAEKAQHYLASIEMTLADPRPDEKEMRKILRKAGPQFHWNTSWGLKIWRRECRLHLIRHYNKQEGQPAPKPWKADLPDDIVFPFRGETYGRP